MGVSDSLLSTCIHQVCGNYDFTMECTMCNVTETCRCYTHTRTIDQDELTLTPKTIISGKSNYSI
jgi:hypothetical protein